jgi:uncharacterized RDD family membrane protein YckC
MPRTARAATESAAARLVAYVVALLVLFAVALGAGRLVGPLGGVAPDEPGPPVHAGMAATTR